jgi:hypothetical protein
MRSLSQRTHCSYKRKEGRLEPYSFSLFTSTGCLKHVHLFQPMFYCALQILKYYFFPNISQMVYLNDADGAGILKGK